MDIKKSPKASLEDKKFVYLLMGLILALTVVYIAFEWTEKEVAVYDIEDTEFLIEEEMDIIQTAEVPPPPPPPPPTPQVVEVLNIVEDDKEVEDVQIISEDDKDEVVDIQVPIEAVEIVEEVEIIDFLPAEDMPKFKGNLNEYLSKNIRYPPIAQETGIQGRVICQFVVYEDGTIRDVKVVRGVDPSLDKEAIRVIENMPKWTPGNQRGRAVKVRYTLPINFRLQ